MDIFYKHLRENPVLHSTMSFSCFVLYVTANPVLSPDQHDEAEAFKAEDRCFSALCLRVTFFLTIALQNSGITKTGMVMSF